MAENYVRKQSWNDKLYKIRERCERRMTSLASEEDDAWRGYNREIKAADKRYTVAAKMVNNSSKDHGDIAEDPITKVKIHGEQQKSNPGNLKCQVSI